MKFPNHGVFDTEKNKNLINLFYPPQKDKLKTFVISLDRDWETSLHLNQ